jgi:hypothetical protein
VISASWSGAVSHAHQRAKATGWRHQVYAEDGLWVVTGTRLPIDCTVCRKRPVFKPGPGLGGALCLPCYYDL